MKQFYSNHCLSTGTAVFQQETKLRNTFLALVQPCLNTCTATHGYMETRIREV